jgi:choline dehydrogenase-like flavoprotein
MGYDYIIVGGGSAGCVLAARLSEDPAVKVLLLEAGGKDSHFLYHWPAGFAKMTKGIGSWGWSTVPQKHMNNRVLWYTQAKVIGGGSSINAQIYTRGNHLDFDTWAQMGCKGWDYDSLLPYFRKSEDNDSFDDNTHGTGGPLGVSKPRAALPICDAFLRAAEQYGIPFCSDLSGPMPKGVGFYQLTQRDARRSSVSSAYLKPAMARSNLAVMLNCMTLRIVCEKSRAVAVKVSVDGELQTFRADREIVVASGAIGSAKVLMLSGIGPADHLKKTGIEPVHDLPGVGSNLQDHLDICTISECTGDHTYDKYGKPWWAALAGLQYILARNGPVSSSLFETGGFWYADKDAAAPDLQFHLGQGSGIEAGIAKLKNPGVTLNAAFMRPRSRGTVRLKDADPASAPLIDPNYWADPYDKEMSLRGLQMARDIMRQPALSRFVQKEVLPGPDLATDADLFAYGCKMGKTDHHPAGTCQMGINNNCVVTPDLKVRGLEGLRIADNSIMPTLVSSNTNATAIMIGEKAADLLRMG